MKDPGPLEATGKVGLVLYHVDTKQLHGIWTSDGTTQLGSSSVGSKSCLHVPAAITSRQVCKAGAHGQLRMQHMCLSSRDPSVIMHIVSSGGLPLNGFCIDLI